jgi:hypothetical protein
MPYIKSDDDRRLKLRNGEPALTAGELNYQIFYTIKHFEELDMQKNNFLKRTIEEFVEQFLGGKPNYQRYNDLTGALIRCIKEINRRLPEINPHILLEIMNSYDDEIAKYEDLKINENGDVE